MSDRTPTRPLLRYHGGKWVQAQEIIKHFPTHRCYVEPYGGGGSVLLKKSRALAEVYNDLDGEIVNLFRVVRDRGAELVAQLELTPYAREEFDLSYEPTADPLERARRTVMRSYMGFGGNLTRQNVNGAMQRTGFRTYSKKNRGSMPAQDWRNYPEALALIIDRLRGVIIENRDAAEVMLAHDSPDTLHYVDPPYVHETRSSYNDNTKRGYRYEMDDAAHTALAAVLCSLQGGGNTLRLRVRSLRPAALP